MEPVPPGPSSIENYAYCIEKLLLKTQVSLTSFLQSEVKIIHIIVQDQDGQNNNINHCSYFKQIITKADDEILINDVNGKTTLVCSVSPWDCYCLEVNTELGSWIITSGNNCQQCYSYNEIWLRMSRKLPCTIHEETVRVLNTDKRL